MAKEYCDSCKHSSEYATNRYSVETGKSYFFCDLKNVGIDYGEEACECYNCNNYLNCEVCEHE